MYLKFKNQNSLIFNSVNWTILSQVAKFNSLYTFIMQGQGSTPRYEKWYC